MARELGVHRDGSNFGLGSIETELRRRVWAHLCILDLRCAMQLGLEPFIAADSYDSALPLGFDDRDLVTGVKNRSREETNRPSQPLHSTEIDYEQHQALTSMSVTLINAECARLFSKLAAIQYRPRDALHYTNAKGTDGAPSFRDRLQLIEHAERKFQIFYKLYDLNPENLQLSLAAEIAAANIVIAKFVAHMREWKEQNATGDQHKKTEDYAKSVSPFPLLF